MVISTEERKKKTVNSETDGKRYRHARGVNRARDRVRIDRIVRETRQYELNALVQLFSVRFYFVCDRVVRVRNARAVCLCTCGWILYIIFFYIFILVLFHIYIYFKFTHTFNAHYSLLYMCMNKRVECNICVARALAARPKNKNPKRYTTEAAIILLIKEA